MGIFIHKKDDLETKTIRNAVNRLETTQRTRIKLGNILVDEVLTFVGQGAYTFNKENIAQAKKDEKGNTEEVTEYDTADVKTIDLIVDAYKKINATATELGVKTVPLRRESEYNKTMKVLIEKEKEEHQQRAEEKLEQWNNDSTLYTKWKTKREKISNKTFSEEPSIESALIATKTLLPSDYISSYITYLNTQGYMAAVKNEKDANLVVNKLVHTSWLWPYIEGIKGCGEITAAYILADIDFRSTIHPSSVLRYLGLDNVTVVPERKPGDTMSKDELARIFRFLIHNYKSIVERSKEKDMPELNQANFYKYATDMVDKWEEFECIRKVYQSPAFMEMSIEEMVAHSKDFKQLVDKVWNRIEVIEYEGKDGKYIPTIKKRARSKKDTVITTYLTSEGKIATKKSLGYNAKLKSRIIEIMFDSMTKAGNPYYYKEIYLNYKKRLEEKYKLQGMEVDKMRIHRQARRVAVQIFIEDLWMWVREHHQWPTNNGTYYEAKLKAKHGQNKVE